MANELLGVAGMAAALGTFMVFIGIALYVYSAWAFMTIAKKLKYENPWLAWIPIVNVFLFPILAKKHWAWGFIFFVPIVGYIFMIVWTWTIYTRRNYPGWLSLIPVAMFIPFVGVIALVAQLVVVGLVAWVDRK